MSEFAKALWPVLPEDAPRASLVGRIWRPEHAGPAVVAVRHGGLVDVTAAFLPRRSRLAPPAPRRPPKSPSPARRACYA